MQELIIESSTMLAHPLGMELLTHALSFDVVGSDVVDAYLMQVRRQLILFGTSGHGPYAVWQACNHSYMDHPCPWPRLVWVAW